MRVFLIFIICGFVALPSTLYAATITRATSSTIKPPEMAYEKLASLKTKEIQKIIGRKLTFKEKISLLVLKHTFKKEAQTKKGNTALIFGIVGVGLLLIGLFVPFVILGAIAAAIVAIVLGSSAKRMEPIGWQGPGWGIIRLDHPGRYCIAPYHCYDCYSKCRVDLIIPDLYFSKFSIIVGNYWLQ
jgi:hypothetical protein